MKTFEQVCEYFEELGFISFKDTFASEHTAAYALPRRVSSMGGPICDCNDKPVPFHVKISKPFSLPNHSSPFLGSISFNTFGECNGKWITMEVYSIAYDELSTELIGKVKRSLEKMWAAFYNTMGD